MSLACQSRSLTLSELHLLGCLSQLIPSAHLPKTEAQSHFGSHIHSMYIPKASAPGPLLCRCCLGQAFRLCPGRAPHYPFWLVAASISTLHLLLPMATRLNFPKHISNDIFPEKPKMVLLTLQDNLHTAFKYFMVWPQLSFSTLSLSVAFLPTYPTSQPYLLFPLIHC